MMNRNRGRSVSSISADSIGSTTRHVNVSHGPQSTYLAETESSARRQRRSVSRDRTPTHRSAAPIPLAPPTRPSSIEVKPHPSAPASQRSTSSRPAIQPVAAAEGVELDVAYRFIDRQIDKTSGSPDVSLVSHGSAAWEGTLDFCNVERRVVVTRDGGRVKSTFHGDQIFGPNEPTMAVSDQLVPKLLRAALDGRPELVVAAGVRKGGKSTTLFSTEGLVASYIQQLLAELTSQRLDGVLQVGLSMASVHPNGATDLLEPSGGDDAASDGEAEPHVWVRVSSPEHARVAGLEVLRQEILTSTAAAHLAIARARTRAVVNQSLHNLIAIVSVHMARGDGHSNLVRVVAPVAFLELNGGPSAKPSTVIPPTQKAHDEKKMSSEIRTVFAVLEAEQRRRWATRKDDVFAAVYESSTTALLSRFLQRDEDSNHLHHTHAQRPFAAPHITLLFHLDRSRPGRPMESLLEMAQWLLEAKYPNGVPVPDYRQIAHALSAQLAIVHEQVRSRSSGLDETIAQLRKENMGLIKAYESACARQDNRPQHNVVKAAAKPKKTTTPQNRHTAPTATPERATQRRSGSLPPPDVSPPSSRRSADEHEHVHSAEFNDVSTLRHQVERLTELLIGAEHEVSILRAQLHNAATTNSTQAAVRSSSSNNNTMLAPPSASPPQSKSFAPHHDDTRPMLCSTCVSLQFPADALAQMITSIERHGVFDDAAQVSKLQTRHGQTDVARVLVAAGCAIDALVRQICERERAFECQVKRTAVHEILANMSVSRAATSPALRTRHADPTAVSDETSPLRQAAAELNDREDTLRHELRHAPLLGWQRWRSVLQDMGSGKDNMYAEGTRFALLDAPTARSTDFFRWWSSTAPFSPASSPGPTPHRNAVTETSPASKLDLLWRESS